MTPATFQTLSIALVRSSMGWQTKIAAKLDVETRTVRRWLKAGKIPDWVEQKIEALTGASSQSPWPRDEWVTGDTFGADGKRREYIVHLQLPRFIARIVACDEEGEVDKSEHPADVVSGTVYTSDGYILSELTWIDEPKSGEVVQLLEAACNEIDRMSDFGSFETQKL